MKSANRYIQPGERVHNPLRPEWGAGQVQSVSENLITVNFENAGKLVIDGTVITLEVWPEAEHG